MKTPRIMAALAALAAMGVMALAACTGAGPAAGPTPVSLSSTSWVLATLRGQPAASGALITLIFEGGMISGSDGCNRYSTSYTVSGSQLTAGKQVITTQMACAAPVMQQADAYIAALIQVAAYQSDGRQLTLLDASGQTLATFVAQTGQLGGTSWTVTGYNNGQQAVVSVSAGSTITAEFVAGGRLTGSAGCNNYTSSYEVSGRTIKIGAAGSTRKLCAEPAGVMEQEAQYLRALETAAAFGMEGDRLELRTAGGELAVTLSRKK